MLHFHSYIRHSSGVVATILPGQQADSAIMVYCRRTAPWLWKMQWLKSMTLGWQSCLVHRYDVVESIFAWIGSRLFNDGLMSSHSNLIIEDARLKNVDAQFTVIFETSQRYCRNHSCIDRRLIVRLWGHVTALPLEFLRCKAICHRLSVDTHFRT